MTLRVHVAVERDEDGWFVATCPELPGCVSQGRTVAEAESNIKEAITVSVETRISLGLPRKVELHEVEVEVPA